MAYLLRDPLLSVTRKLLGFFSAACLVFAVLILVLGVLGLAFGIHTSQYAHHSPMDDGPAALLFVSLAPLLALYGWFLRILRQIVDTVAAGTPFIVANADRLTRMGWLALAMKLLVLVEASLLQTSLAQFARFGSRFDGPGLLMILVLFILARVFRQGSAMREDLEGTV